MRAAGRRDWEEVMMVLSRLRSRRWHGVLVALFLATAVLPLGGWQVRQAARDTVTIQVWTPWTDTPDLNVWHKVVGMFEKAYPTISVKLVPGADTTKTLTAISGGNPPDVFANWDATFVGTWAHNGAVQDLTPLMAQAHIGPQIAPGYMNLVTVGGRYYALPYMGDGYMFVYNTAMFKAAHIARPPVTLEEMTADAYKLTKMDSSGHLKVIGYSPSYNGCCPSSNLPLLGDLFGGHWYDSKMGKVTADDPANVRALEWEMGFYKKYGAANINRFQGSFGSTYSPTDPFIQGRVAMGIMGEWEPIAFDRWGHHVPYAVAPIPYPKGHPEQAYSNWATSSVMALPRGCKHPKEAWAFMTYLATTFQAQMALANGIGNLPALKEGLRAGRLLTQSKLAVFADYLAHSRHVYSWPPLPITQEYITRLSLDESRALDGKMTAQQALQDVTARMQPVLTKALGH
jgi:multiple sugar transport system substrate-binding protein